MLEQIVIGCGKNLNLTKYDFCEIYYLYIKVKHTNEHEVKNNDSQKDALSMEKENHDSNKLNSVSQQSRHENLSNNLETDIVHQAKQVIHTRKFKM